MPAAERRAVGDARGSRSLPPTCKATDCKTAYDHGLVLCKQQHKPEVIARDSSSPNDLPAPITVVTKVDSPCTSPIRKNTVCFHGRSRVDKSRICLCSCGLLTVLALGTQVVDCDEELASDRGVACPLPRPIALREHSTLWGTPNSELALKNC